jgi:NADH:ubiquinone oxidoreductase subunit 5 (subunit L)/multisubunit Na+/H+ antiporter MnhA subunit
MLAAALLALRERDLKRILAYSTVVALRTLGEIAVLAAAAALGISRVTLWSKMKRLGLGR